MAKNYAASGKKLSTNSPWDGKIKHRKTRKKRIDRAKQGMLYYSMSPRAAAQEGSELILEN
ncbi:hypothetical protein BM613_02235 [Sulfoacidibacillus thermotolerans]|uniref:Uncharacterized protein n=1 Tax=Sulfoacidibacillus thermotolerans TaxID=1765684 RepID=A0A2U3DCB9_SULT2|nr:hypothetical protein BM613_02235 [Sulfoacidibacillus thermotolerans]